MLPLMRTRHRPRTLSVLLDPLLGRSIGNAREWPGYRQAIWQVGDSTVRGIPLEVLRYLLVGAYSIIRSRHVWPTSLLEHTMKRT